LILFTVSAHAMDSLPIELHSKIIKNIFNCVIYQHEALKKDIDQKILEAYILKIPIELGVKFVNEFDYLQTLCQSKIGDKQFSARELFILPQEERAVFIRMRNRSMFLKGNISKHDYKILKMMENKDVLKGLQLKVNFMDSKIEYLEHVATVSLLLGALSTYKGSSIGYVPIILFGFSASLKCFAHILHISISHSNMKKNRYIKKKQL